MTIEEQGHTYSLIENGKPPEPTWEPPKGSYGGDLRVVYSYKMQRDFYLCYPLEWYHFLLLDCDPLVKWLCEHPLKVKAKVDGRIVETTFDMWVLWHTSREELREVKKQSRLENGSSYRQVTAQKNWCKFVGIDYTEVSETTLCRQPLLENCRQMHPYLAQNPGADWERKVLSAIEYHSPFPLADLCGATRLETQKLWHAAMHLLWRGELFAPLDTKPWHRLTLEKANDDHKRNHFC